MTRSFVSTWLAAGVLCPLLLSAQDAQFCTLTGVGEGSVRAVATDGNVIYLGAGTRLTVLERLPSPPDSLVRRGSRVHADRIRGLALADTLLLAAVGSAGLQVYGVQDPLDPHLLGVVDLGDEVLDVAVRQDKAYVAAHWAGLQVVDLADPSHPVRLGGVQTLDARAVAVQGDQAFVADGEAGMRVVDVGDPTQPRLVGRLFSQHESQDVAVRDTLAFLADGNAGVRVVDVRNAEPVQLGRYDTQGSATALALLDSLVLVADGDSGLCLVSALFPQWPHEVGRVQTPGSAVALDLAGSLACLGADGAGLRLVEVGSPAFAAVVGSDPLPGHAHGLSLQDDQVLVANAAGGRIQRFQLDVGVEPHFLGAFTPLVPSWNVSWSGDLAITAADTAGLRILDLSLPGDPVELGFLDDDLNATWQAGRLVDGRAHVLLHVPATPLDPEFSVYALIDLADPADPQVEAVLELPGHAYDVEVVDDFVYVAAGEVGLVVIDVADPAAVEVVGHLETPGVAHAVDVVDDRAYIADGLDGQLRIVDVADPAELQVLGVFDTGTWVVDVEVRDWVAFVAAWDLGLRVVDVSDPTLPVERGWLDTPGHTVQLELAPVGDTVLLADGEAGLLRVAFDRLASGLGPLGPSRPRSFETLSALPNPFNPGTTLRYNLDIPGRVELGLFNLAGQRVATLDQGFRGAGWHQVHFDGSALASGVYVATLQAGGRSESQKLILAK